MWWLSFGSADRNVRKVGRPVWGSRPLTDEAFSVQKLVPTGPGPTIDIYAVITSNLSYPAGTTGQYAFQQFSALDRMFPPYFSLSVSGFYFFQGRELMEN